MADEAPVDEERFTPLQQGSHGDLQRPGDEGYDEASQLWNGRFDKRPTIVAMCTGTADVIDFVNFARENGLRVAVRGGGYGIRSPLAVHAEHGCEFRRSKRVERRAQDLGARFLDRNAHVRGRGRVTCSQSLSQGLC